MGVSRRHVTIAALGASVCVLSIGIAHISYAQQAPGVIGSVYPTQLMPGQSTSVHVALPRTNPIQSIEITPSTGVTVSNLKSRDLNQGSVWWAFSVAVPKDAAPGPRTLVAAEPGGRTAPVTLLSPDHIPNISNLRVVSAQAAQPMVDLQLTASNQGGGRFGETPKVWFLLACGPGQPEAGIVRGKADNATIRASIPNPRTLQEHAGAPATGDRCDLQVRATDTSGIDSNMLNTTFDFK